MAKKQLDLTPREAEVLRAIEKRWRRGYQPFLRELGDDLDISIGVVHKHIKALRRKNALEPRGLVPRGSR